MDYGSGPISPLAGMIFPVLNAIMSDSDAI